MSSGQRVISDKMKRVSEVEEEILELGAEDLLQDLGGRGEEE